MTPDFFTFQLTIPNDPAGATVVAVVTTHAVEYAGVDAAAGEAFVQKVRATAAQELKGARGEPSLVTVDAANGLLTVRIGGQSVSTPLPS